MQKRRALVITYHVKNCQRVGGFHRFISFLEEDGFDIDWLSSVVSVAWLWHHDDRANARNFIDLVQGFEFDENGAHVRQISAPIWMPAQIARRIDHDLYDHYWPSWGRVRRLLAEKYDVILVEGTGAQYADDLRSEYPMAKIIYRPSDIMNTYTAFPDADAIELNMIRKSDITWCVDEQQMAFYIGIGAPPEKISILRNPCISEDELRIFEDFHPRPAVGRKSVIYIGVSGVDIDCIEYAAERNQHADFVVVGPFERQSHDNVIYTGSLPEAQYLPRLEKASVGIEPVVTKFEKVKLGYTRKVLRYMRYLLPVVVTRHDNYRDVKGFVVANGYEDFSNKVKEALEYSNEDREALRSGYAELFETFTDKTVKKQFDDCILQGANGPKKSTKKIIFLTASISDATGGAAYDEVLHKKLEENLDPNIELVTLTDEAFDGEHKEMSPDFVRMAAVYRDHWRQIVDCDYLIMNSRLYTRLVNFPWGKKPSRCKVIMIHHHFNYMTESGPRRLIHKQLEIQCLRNASTIITPNRYTEDMLREHGFAEGARVVEALNIDNEISTIANGTSKNFLFVGNVIERKGIEYGLEAFKLFYVQHPDYTFTIVGDYSSEPRYKDLLDRIVAKNGLGDAVVFRGRVSTEEKENSYLDARAFVFPSQNEGYGWVMVEAMQHGLPVIAYNNTAMPYTVNDTNGFLVANKSITGMANALSAVADNDDVFRSLQKGALRTVGELPSTDQIENEYIELLNELSNGEL